MKKRAVYLIICIFLVPLASFGQIVSSSSETKVELQRTIQLKNDSKTEEIIIDIKPKTLKLAMWINSSVTHGTLTIEVYDPKGTKQGNYTIGTQLISGKYSSCTNDGQPQLIGKYSNGQLKLISEKKEIVQGNIRKSLVEPQFGKWIVKIIPTDVTGNIRIQTANDE